MREKEMKIIARFISKIYNEVKKHQLPEDKEERNKYLKKFKNDIVKNKTVTKVKKEVLNLCKKFPLPS